MTLRDHVRLLFWDAVTCALSWYLRHLIAKDWARMSARDPFAVGPVLRARDVEAALVEYERARARDRFN